MDVKLQNAYVEVVLDNFISVIKQNLMFQTQLQLSNDIVKENENIKNQIEDLKKRNLDLQSLVDNLNKNNTELKSVANKKTEDSNYFDSLKNDKSRIQTALNDTLRELKKLKEDLQLKNDVLESQNKYIESLEKSVPSNRLKKLKSVDITQFQSSEKTESDVQSGGTF
jgi:chromosome segregation ATPase